MDSIFLVPVESNRNEGTFVDPYVVNNLYLSDNFSVIYIPYQINPYTFYYDLYILHNLLHH